AIDLDLERHAELPAIAEHGLMVARQPRRAGVEVEIRIELADLSRAVAQLDGGAAADRPVAAADPVARLEHGAIVAGLAELVGGGESRDPSAEHDDLGAVARAALERQRLSDGLRRNEPHRLHGEIGGAIAADLRDAPQEISTCAGHRNPICT